FARGGNSTSPGQPVKSLPLKRAWKPWGGLLSFGPAFSSAGALTASIKAPTKPSRNGNLFMRVLPEATNSHSLGVGPHGGGDSGQKQGENDAWKAPRKFFPILLTAHRRAGKRVPRPFLET